MAFLVLPSSTRWTASAPTIFDAVQLDERKTPCQCDSCPLPYRRRIGIQRHGRSRHHEAPVFFHDETLGADWEETDIPADLLRTMQRDACNTARRARDHR